MHMCCKIAKFDVMFFIKCMLYNFIYYTKTYFWRYLSADTYQMLYSFLFHISSFICNPSQDLQNRKCHVKAMFDVMFFIKYVYLYIIIYIIHIVLYKRFFLKLLLNFFSKQTRPHFAKRNFDHIKLSTSTFLSPGSNKIL